ncbi:MULTISPECIES: spondin domain-containing protein [Shewanella]|uniref:Spondin domain-containing protein n=2 Tax=Unclassified Bacteria TaxID=49928 RepID=A0AAU6VSC1_UNCXX|nr:MULTISPECIES: spondin domain-containing protein [Shewanella]MBO2559455.1 spondin domain-containing protein [Shewanella algae]MBO2567832.1 spondin domain-containing protein [Shewanella algae]MBO2614651.1 spondin domain-containing protein [Shewanella algae]MBO2618765.1 spondin domain-containing protein [Shewanella algae]MBO2643960.1 spondin domain-containing protein [Shewanella algae]
MKPKLLLPLLLSTLPLSQLSQAAQLEISINNLTHGNHFTPLLIAAHDGNSHLFQAGEPASSALQKMAEGGDISELQQAVTANNGVIVANPAAGLLAPGARVEKVMLDSGALTHLSLVAMLLPTNDAFVGLDGWEIPSTPGSYTLYLNAYDAGTEANDEQITGGGAPGVPGIPAAPDGMGGQNGTGVMDDSSNDRVHIHPGLLGDTDPNGGISDVDSRIHRWLNPVAALIVTVK